MEVLYVINGFAHLDAPPLTYCPYPLYNILLSPLLFLFLPLCSAFPNSFLVCNMFSSHPQPLSLPYVRSILALFFPPQIPTRLRWQTTHSSQRRLSLAYAPRNCM